MATNFADLIPLPNRSQLNSGLTTPSSSFMENLFGTPGNLTSDCSPLTNTKLKSLVVERSVGPFVVEGLSSLLDDLEKIFAKVKAENPLLYNAVKQGGMLCCRAKRPASGGPSTSFSNHSYGAAVDLFFGSKFDPQGDGKCQRGLLDLYPYFHEMDWYWGGGYSPSQEDAMHFEASVELLSRRYSPGSLLNPPSGSVELPRSPLFSGRPDFAAIASGSSFLRRTGERNEASGLLQDGLNKLATTFPQLYGECAVDTQNGSNRGIFGPKTDKALGTFQSIHNLVPSGILDATTLSLLDDALMVGLAPLLKHSIFAGHPVLQALAAGQSSLGLKEGVEQDGVKEIRLAVKTLFPNLISDTTSEIFDRSLEKAITKFQSGEGLDADGIVGKNTIGRLDTMLRNRPGTGSPGPTTASGQVRDLEIKGGDWAILHGLPWANAVNFNWPLYRTNSSGTRVSKPADYKGMVRLPGGVLFYESNMDIDADGSPNALIIDPNNGQLQTSFTYPNETGQRRFVDAEKVPYIVLSGSKDGGNFVFRNLGFRTGDLAAVVFKGRWSPAIIADIGPTDKTGEGSVALAQALKHDPFNTSGLVAISIGRGVHYVVFPNSQPPGLTPGNAVQKIRDAVSDLFESLGADI